MKMFRSMFKLLVFVSIFNLIAMPLYSFAEDNQFDQKLVDAGKQKAKQMGHNPVCIFVNKNESIVITQSLFTIKNSQATFVDGDMVINVGKDDATIWGTILKEGEYGIIKNGKLEKGKDLILPAK
jgi:hypothetical protein